MNEYIETNRKSWGLLAEEHYKTFKELLSKQKIKINATQQQELGSVVGKSLIHLQCNTGADSISLARMGATVTGVDLVPQNIYYARKLADDLNVNNTRFLVCDVLELMNHHDEKYDIVYTTEGVLCWIPDLKLWARNVRHLMKDDGFLYLFDLHPLFMVWDLDALPALKVRYPYFEKNADRNKQIGGYASERKDGTNYTWVYTISDIVNAMSDAGMHIEWLHEYDWIFFNLNENEQVQNEDCNWVYPDLIKKLPFSFSLKATARYRADSL